MKANVGVTSLIDFGGAASFLFLTLLLLRHICICTGTDICPPVSSGCRCSVKLRGPGIRVQCRGLRTVSFFNLPSHLSADIDLSGNRLEAINRTTFPHPNRIRKLNLRNNLISEIKPFSFQGFTILKKIDLSGNRLTVINENTFSGLNMSISMINLSGNRILDISQKAFSTMKINKLILSYQLNAKEQKADLIGYHDFLTLSLIKYVNFDDNNLLCDCNLNWLLSWITTNNNQKVSANSSCYYPVEMRGVSVAELVSLGEKWRCDAHTFSLPHFQIDPIHQQLLFENDSFLVSCEATWVNSAYFVWTRNGVVQEPGVTPWVTVKHYYNVSVGLYESTLKIDRLSRNDHTVTCQLMVKNSGTVSATTNMVLYHFVKKQCKPSITFGDRGTVFWGTTTSGATVETTCPFGGLQLNAAHRSCRNGSWDEPDLRDCIFRSRVTRTLQRFYNDSKDDSPVKVIQMAKAFYPFFRQELYKMSSKYDLYFMYETLRKIMLIYKQERGEYTGFFWGTIGVISQTYAKVNTMSENLYGIQNKKRYRDLVESFLSQESEKSGNFFKINNHPAMAALSLKQTTKLIAANAYYCYITTPPSQQLHQLVGISCSAAANLTLAKVSSVSMQLIIPRLVAKVRITLVVYRTDTFFQHGLDQKLDMIAPIVGIKMEDASLTGRKNITKQAHVTFRDLTPSVPNKFMMWEDDAYEEKSGWKEYNPGCNGFQCVFSTAGNMVYLTLATEKPKVVILAPKFMEPVLYVTAGLSCFFLLCTLLTYFLVRALRANRSDAATLMNLCLALIVSEVVFACGMHRTDNLMLCKGVALTLHYFLLCALVWLGCGGIVLIRVLKKKNKISREYDPVLKYYLVGWGLPLIICSVTVAYDRNNYGTSNYCWLDSRSALAAFICPASLILLTDLIIFCCLHALINRIYPELEENESVPNPPIAKPTCSAMSCKLKVNKSEPSVEFPFPRRTELINYLHGCLSVLLLFCLAFTFTLMMYSYKFLRVWYLYYLFTYAAALCNLLLGSTILFFHFLKRKDTWTLFKLVVSCKCCCCCGVTTKDIAERHLVDEEEEEVDGTRHSIPNTDAGSVAPSNYGAGECIVSESSPVLASVRVELCESLDGKGESFVQDQSEIDRGPSFEIKGHLFDPVRESLDAPNESYDARAESFDMQRKSIDVGCESSDTRGKSYERIVRDKPLHERSKSYSRRPKGPERRNKGFENRGKGFTSRIQSAHEFDSTFDGDTSEPPICHFPSTTPPHHCTPYTTDNNDTIIHHAPAPAPSNHRPSSPLHQNSLEQPNSQERPPPSPPPYHSLYNRSSSPINHHITPPVEISIPNGKHERKSSLRNSITNQSQRSQSDPSEVERHSAGGCNSIGECSLASGSQRKQRVRPVNPDIPENLKSFVPQDWKPARRRKKPRPGESYYPYFHTDVNPSTASFAYSSKSSSIASTIVSGVPLYINKQRTANNFAMYNDLFTPTSGLMVAPSVVSTGSNAIPTPNNTSASQPSYQPPPVPPPVAPPPPPPLTTHPPPKMHQPTHHHHNNSSMSGNINMTNVNNTTTNNTNRLPMSNIQTPLSHTPNSRHIGTNSIPMHGSRGKLQRPIHFPTSPGSTHKPFPLETPYYGPVYGGIPVNVVKPMPQDNRCRYPDSGGSSVELNRPTAAPQQLQQQQQLRMEHTSYQTDRSKINSGVSGRISEETEEEEEIKVAPVIYIPVPHVSIKQFEKRCETSV